MLGRCTPIPQQHRSHPDPDPRRALLTVGFANSRASFVEVRAGPVAKPTVATLIEWFAPSRPFARTVAMDKGYDNNRVY